MSDFTWPTYPVEAYAPDGELWWHLQVTPGKRRRFGDEQKIAAYLAYHVGRGGTFTMRSLRSALGEDTVPNDAEHLNRRLRALRIRDKWTVHSGKDDGTLAHDEYRVHVIGWHPGTGIPRPRDDTPSDAVRRRVFARDQSICQVCFTPGGEPYVDLPDRVARLTLGHRVPGKRLDGKATVDDLQTECARCNEAVRDELFDPVTLPEVLPVLRSLKRAEKTELLRWLEEGFRAPSRTEQAYANVRRLSESETAELLTELRHMVRQS